MNTTQKLTTAGITGILGLSLGMTPAMAAPDKDMPQDTGNAVSVAAQAKAQGENNRAAAHAHAFGQLKKAEIPSDDEIVEENDEGAVEDGVEDVTTNPVALAAQVKLDGESNRAAAHAFAPGLNKSEIIEEDTNDDGILDEDLSVAITADADDVYDSGILSVNAGL